MSRTHSTSYVSKSNMCPITVLNIINAILYSSTITNNPQIWKSFFTVGVYFFDCCPFHLIGLCCLIKIIITFSINLPLYWLYTPNCKCRASINGPHRDVVLITVSINGKWVGVEITIVGSKFIWAMKWSWQGKETDWTQRKSRRRRKLAHKLCPINPPTNTEQRIYVVTLLF